jgi:rod shape-determining protein MreC
MSSLSFFRRGPSFGTQLIFCWVLAIAMMLGDHSWLIMKTMRSFFDITLRPMQSIVTKPLRTAQIWRDAFEDQTTLLRENHQLKQEKMLLQAALKQNSHLEDELSVLRTLNGLKNTISKSQTIAEVIQNIDQPFSETLLINKGSEDLISLGSPVIDQYGLLGQVYEVNPLSSSVRLLSHHKFLVSVMSERSGARALLGGDGKSISLRFAPGHIDVQEGDILVTSGIDHVFPAGIPVAKVSRIHRGNGATFATIDCIPIGKLHSSRFILILEPPKTS